MITQEMVKRFFHYDPESGVVRRIKRFKPIPGGTDGSLVDCDWVLSKPSKGGYVHARLNGKYVTLHKLIWVYMTGVTPSLMIDHIDGNRLNNRWVNLRLVDPSDSSCNRGVRVDNSSGVVGVYLHQCGKWAAQICRRGEYSQLGYFSTFAEAVDVRKRAERELEFHVNHGARPSWRG